MKIACIGFLSEQTGSIAVANAVLFRTLVQRGVEVDFFFKPSFVDPRSVVGGRRGLRFPPTINQISDTIHREVHRVFFVGFIAAHRDSVNYNRLLIRRISNEHQRRSYDLCLWLDYYARGFVPGIPTVSFVQCPPGMDTGLCWRGVIRNRARRCDVAQS